METRQFQFMKGMSNHHLPGQKTRCNPSTSSFRRLFEWSMAKDSIGIANMMQQRTEYVVMVKGRADKVSSSHGLIC